MWPKTCVLNHTVRVSGGQSSQAKEKRHSCQAGHSSGLEVTAQKPKMRARLSLGKVDFFHYTACLAQFDFNFSFEFIFSMKFLESCRVLLRKLHSGIQLNMAFRTQI